MRTSFAILFCLLATVSFSQPKKCTQPIVTGSFTPTITLPDNNYSFGLSAVGQNGEGIQSYQYTLMTGNGTLVNPNAANASITNLVAGITTVRAIIRDSCGSADTSNIILTVNAAVVTPPNWVLNLVPNPAFTHFTASLSGPGSGSTIFYFENGNGNRLLEERTNKANQSAAASVMFNNISRYRSGTYIVQAYVNNKFIISAKLVIAR